MCVCVCVCVCITHTHTYIYIMDIANSIIFDVNVRACGCCACVGKRWVYEMRVSIRSDERFHSPPGIMWLSHVTLSSLDQPDVLSLSLSLSLSFSLSLSLSLEFGHFHQLDFVKKKKPSGHFQERISIKNYIIYMDRLYHLWYHEEDLLNMRQFFYSFKLHFILCCQSFTFHVKFLGSEPTKIAVYLKRLLLSFAKSGTRA